MVVLLTSSPSFQETQGTTPGPAWQNAPELRVVKSTFNRAFKSESPLPRSSGLTAVGLAGARWALRVLGTGRMNAETVVKARIKQDRRSMSEEEGLSSDEMFLPVRHKEGLAAQQRHRRAQVGEGRQGGLRECLAAPLEPR